MGNAERSANLGTAVDDQKPKRGSSLGANSAEHEAPVDEAELIRRIFAGERERYYDLIAPYERKAYIVAFSILQNPAEAEDCVQDAVLNGLRHLDQFRGEGRFGHWLIRIVVNQAKLRLRKLRPQLQDSLDGYEPEDKDGVGYAPHVLGDWREVPSEALERKEVRCALVAAVEKLPEIYREVFILRDVEENDVVSTAQILGVSQAVVKTRLLRARLQLRDLLAPALKFGPNLRREWFKKGRNPWL
jgi:RNA polymerase sigma-70 factor (ECF subfamily)